MRYRLYFNRKSEFPCCWSVDEGTQETETNIIGFVLDGVRAESQVMTTAERGILDPNNVPFAWMNVTGRLRLQAGLAYFSSEGAEP
jgi:hypothetical protein